MKTCAVCCEVLEFSYPEGSIIVCSHCILTDIEPREFGNFSDPLISKAVYRARLKAHQLGLRSKPRNRNGPEVS